MKNMFFDISLGLEERLRVIRPAEARHSRVLQGTVIYDLTYQKGLRPYPKINITELTPLSYLRPDISKGITTPVPTEMR